MHTKTQNDLNLFVWPLFCISSCEKHLTLYTPCSLQDKVLTRQWSSVVHESVDNSISFYELFKEFLVMSELIIVLFFVLIVFSLLPLKHVN